MIKCLLIFFTAIIVALSQGPKNTTELDYRKHGLVGKVRNQGSCNNGWIYALIGDIEGQYAKKRGELVDFSAQELIDCLNQCRRCYYCDNTIALNSLINLGGIERDEDYPLVEGHQHCQYKPAISKVSVVYYNINILANEDRLMKLLEDYGPLYITIDGSGLRGYTRGILDQCPYNERNHAVLLIGYGTEDGTDYWLIKNSLGESWGQQGFGKIRRNVNACGIMNSWVFTLGIKDKN